MALVLLQAGISPLGQYDAVDGYTTTILGGEVCQFTSVAIASDKAAADYADGYLNPGTSRAALTVNLSTGADGYGPWMLTDEGTTNYGTLFGTVVGGTVGQVATGGAVLGPHTATGSGKWAAWDKPGLYGVTLDACDTSATLGLQPTNASLIPGAALYAAKGAQTTLAAGRLTPQSSLGAGGAGAVVMGRFVEFRTNDALVTTPNRLVSALNSPSSTVGGVLSNSLFMAVFHFNPEM